MREIVLKTPSCDSVIYCGAGAFDGYAPSVAGEQLFVVTDTNVYELYEKLIKKTFGEKIFVLEAGEESKNPENLLKILRAMLDGGMRRNCRVIAFGGGVVGDIAGLAASLYMRGVRLTQVPTTLLAQVDSSVGGKTAVDMGGVKNILGAFYQPEKVVCDPRFLDTLPEREIKCGLGEIVKYGALDGNIYSKLMVNAGNLAARSFLEDIIYDCVAYKAEVVKKDERDLSGARKALNLGHTTGHAFELYYGGKSHGECVLIGAYYELYIARKYGICGGYYADNLEKLILGVLKEKPVCADADKAAQIAVHDKKNDDENISLIVPEREGVCRELKIGLTEYKTLLAECARAAGGGK